MLDYKEARQAIFDRVTTMIDTWEAEEADIGEEMAKAMALFPLLAQDLATLNDEQRHERLQALLTIIAGNVGNAIMDMQAAAERLSAGFDEL